MLRLVQPTGGSLLFRGRDVTAERGPAFRDFRLACQIVFQDPYSSLNPRQRVREIVTEPLDHEPGLTRTECRARVAETFDAVGLPGMEDRFPHQLSGGQRQRVAIARAIVRHPALLVTDEPVSALDMTVQKQILVLIRSLQAERGFACLFISHDLGAVAEVADRVAVMQDGVIVEEGPRDAIFEAPQHPCTRDILALLRDRGARPGEKLSRAALAEALGVSRTPVNGAVALLERLGVLTTEGRSVRLISLDADASPLVPGDATGGVAPLLVAIARGRADGTVPEQVSERQLAQILGASRGTVSAALTQLAEIGVIVRNRGHGWHFAAGFSSPAERAASYRFRMLIEPAALLEPGFVLPPEFASRMRREHEAFLGRPWRDDDAVAFFRINAAFHDGLAEASGNRYIAGAVAQQNRLRTLSNYSWRVGPERVETSVREHLTILDTVRSADRERAALQMRLHLADAMALKAVENG